jgi:Transposase, Mutator family
VLVLIGATVDGSKELIAVVDGYRESSQSWRELFGQLKRLGLSIAPKLAIGDGSLGFWIALQEEYGPVAHQRCWVHKLYLDVAQLDIHFEERLFHVVNGLSTGNYQVVAQAHIGSELANLLIRAKRSIEQPEAVKLFNPLAIEHVGFGSPWQILYMPCINHRISKPYCSKTS